MGSFFISSFSRTKFISSNCIYINHNWYFANYKLAKNGNICYSLLDGQLEDFGMATMNISLPPLMRAYIEEQTRAEGYSTASEFVRALVREDQKRKARERLEGLLLAG